MTCRLSWNYSLSVVAPFSAVGPGFGSTTLVAAMIRATLTLAVLLTLLLIAARPAQAQTETVLYNFDYNTYGGYPESRLTLDGAGNFYGTTGGGGQWGWGTVFELSPNGSGGWNPTCFTASPEGPTGQPLAL